MRNATLLGCALLLSACNSNTAPSATDTAPPATETASPAPVAEPMPTPSIPIAKMPVFVNTPWRADVGSGVEVGTVYTFQADGTLLIASPHGTPARGTWRMLDDALTMTEEGIDYATDIVAQDADHLHLRSHNPGGVVELMLVRDAPAQ
jgi:type IV pilus biogenesis protein CpaD/CtpE